ncbi:Tetratricopeptide-like helical domain superfamily [Sesbania bispinosa]|nr:Tetratricopeptide-like helical domain superfamily [Sesbania bispinosa]
MAEEAPASEASATMPQPAEVSTVDGTLNLGDHEKNGISLDAEPASNAEASCEASGSDGPKSLDLAAELMDKGNKAMKENDFGEAADNFSRALEIRVAHYGELAPECVHTYYKYGCALLYKAQEEADPLADVPKKENGSQHGSNKDGSVKSSMNAESSTASFPSNVEQDVNSNDKESAVDEVSAKNDQEEEDEDSDDEDLAEADEDESDLDLAWKMLDIARAIVEKQSVNTVEQVDILSALAEVAMERGLSNELEKKLEDLQQLVSNPKSILSEILGIAAAKAGSGKESSAGNVSSSQMATVNSKGGFDSPTVSTAHSNGSAAVTHLGVVGRGVKRASNASAAEATTPKKPALESTEDKGDGGSKVTSV